MDSINMRLTCFQRQPFNRRCSVAAGGACSTDLPTARAPAKPPTACRSGEAERIRYSLLHFKTSRPYARGRLVLPYTRGSISLSHGGQGESLVPPYTRGSVSLSRGPGRKPGASLYTRKRLSLTGGSKAKAWCLLIHAEASLSHGGQGESL